MAKIGVLIETENGQLKPSNRGVLTAARQNGENEVFAIVFDAFAGDIKDELAESGAGKIITLSAESGPVDKNFDLLSRALEEVIENFSLNGMLGLASAGGKDIFARLAARMVLPMVSDVISIDFNAKTVRKSHFSGKAVATLKLKSEVMLCTVRPNAIDPQFEATTTELIDYTAQVKDSGRLTIVEVEPKDDARIDLTEAEVIITGGRPIGSKEHYQILYDCAELMGAAVGASRAAVDAGYAPHSMQIGQTGKTVSPKLYIGCGLSGSVQHFAGMKTSKVIVAINTDKDAPIFEKCDYGIIGDLFKVVPEITRQLKTGENGKSGSPPLCGALLCFEESRSEGKK
jgi:electron transfer flavoprotein alpha subunit